MKAQNFVKYEFHDSKHLGFYVFSNYKMSNGKKVKYLDVNGDPGTIKWTDSTVLLNMENEGHVLIDEFLRYNPAVLSNEWKRTDLHEAESKITKDTLDSARAVIEAAKMSDSDVIGFSTLKRYNLNADIDVLRAKIITYAQTNPEAFMDAYFDPEKDLRVFIVEAIRGRKIEFRNNTFYYGKEAIGTNEEQLLVWLKDNKDIHAILKHEIRGESLPKKEKKTTKVK